MKYCQNNDISNFPRIYNIPMLVVSLSYEFEGNEECSSRHTRIHIILQIIVVTAKGKEAILKRQTSEVARTKVVKGVVFKEEAFREEKEGAKGKAVKEGQMLDRVGNPVGLNEPPLFIFIFIAHTTLISLPLRGLGKDHAFDCANTMKMNNKNHKAFTCFLLQRTRETWHAVTNTTSDTQ